MAAQNVGEEFVTVLTDYKTASTIHGMSLTPAPMAHIILYMNDGEPGVAHDIPVDAARSTYTIGRGGAVDLVRC